MLEPPALNCLTDKRLLVGSQVYFHVARLRANIASVKRAFNSCLLAITRRDKSQVPPFRACTMRDPFPTASAVGYALSPL